VGKRTTSSRRRDLSSFVIVATVLVVALVAIYIIYFINNIYIPSGVQRTVVGMGYTVQEQVPEPFAPPIDPNSLSGLPYLRVQTASSASGTTLTVDVVKESYVEKQYIYKTGYYSKDGQWIMFNFANTAVSGTNWTLDTALQTILYAAPGAPLSSNEEYVIVFVCRKYLDYPNYYCGAKSPLDATLKRWTIQKYSFSAVCNNNCTPPGAVRCDPTNNKAVQACGLLQGSCYNWTTTSTCAANQVCMDGTCQVLVYSCTLTQGQFCAGAQPANSASNATATCASGTSCYKCNSGYTYNSATGLCDVVCTDTSTNATVCAAVGRQCGTATDICGNVRTCPTCTGGTTCNANGQCVATCAGCTIGGVCYTDGASNPANTCQKCVKATSTTAWSNITDGTACAGGTCRSCAFSFDNTTTAAKGSCYPGYPPICCPLSTDCAWGATSVCTHQYAAPTTPETICGTIGSTPVWVQCNANTNGKKQGSYTCSYATADQVACGTGTCGTWKIATTCTPNCAGKACGDNGCGGSCGTCTTGYTCSAAGQCICTPNCSGKNCGADGCGGSCGTCTTGYTCNTAGVCVSTCTSTCSAAQLNTYQCLSGQSCPLVGGYTCSSVQQCQQPQIGCYQWVTTKPCLSTETCNAATGTCVSTCTPSCIGKTCGDNGCGGSCGTCGNGYTCNAAGQCIATATPDTDAATCLAATDMTPKTSSPPSQYAGDYGIAYLDPWPTNAEGTGKCCGNVAGEYLLYSEGNQNYKSCCNNVNDCIDTSGKCYTHNQTPVTITTGAGTGNQFCWYDWWYNCDSTSTCLAHKSGAATSYECYYNQASGVYKWLPYTNTETCGDGIDNNCNNQVDEACVNIRPTSISGTDGIISGNIIQTNNAPSAKAFDISVNTLYSSSGENSKFSAVVRVTSGTSSSLTLGNPSTSIGSYLTLNVTTDSSNEIAETSENDNTLIRVVPVPETGMSLGYEIYHCGGHGEWPCDNAHPTQGKMCYDTTLAACSATCSAAYPTLHADGGCWIR